MNAEQITALELILRLAEQGSMPRNEGDPIQNKAFEVMNNYLQEMQWDGIGKRGSDWDSLANSD